MLKISICRINSKGAPKKTNSDNQSTINRSLIAVVVLFLYISSYIAKFPDYFLPSTTLCMPKSPETGFLWSPCTIIQKRLVSGVLYLCVFDCQKLGDFPCCFRPILELETWVPKRINRSWFFVLRFAPKKLLKSSELNFDVEVGWKTKLHEKS